MLGSGEGGHLLAVEWSVTPKWKAYPGVHYPTCVDLLLQQLEEAFAIYYVVSLCKLFEQLQHQAAKATCYSALKRRMRVLCAYAVQAPECDTCLGRWFSLGLQTDLLLFCMP